MEQNLGVLCNSHNTGVTNVAQSIIFVLIVRTSRTFANAVA